MNDKKNPLSNKMKLFVASYAITRNATQAAITAGYKETSARDRGSRLLKHPKIQIALGRRSSKIMRKLEITVDKIAEEISFLAFSNIRDCYDEIGNLLPIHKLPREVAAAITEVTESIDKMGNRVVRYKMDGKTKNLELLGRYHQMFVDKVEVTTKDQFYEDIINNAKSHPKHAILERQRAMLEAIEHDPGA